MNTGKILWWAIGGVVMILVGYVVYLFVIAPLPEHWMNRHTDEAKMGLARACELQKNYHKQHGHYAPHIDSLGIYQSEQDGGKYWLEVEKADSKSVIIRSYARVDFDNDGNQNVWECGLDCLPRELQPD